jgi:hypothetical protein
MNKAITGAFPDSVSGARAINDLKASGFAGESISQVVREDAVRGQRKGPRIFAGLEPLKGLISGAIAGGILGGIASYLFGKSMTWPSMDLTDPLLATVITFAVVGAICGVLEGLAALGPLARARRALMLSSRGDVIVTVHTDETHSGRAGDIMRAAGAMDVRRGASSVADEFRTAEAVQPEMYGTGPVVRREPVETPAGESETAGTPPSTGGTIG